MIFGQYCTYANIRAVSCLKLESEKHNLSLPNTHVHNSISCAHTHSNAARWNIQCVLFLSGDDPVCRMGLVNRTSKIEIYFLVKRRRHIYVYRDSSFFSSIYLVIKVRLQTHPQVRREYERNCARLEDFPIYCFDLHSPTRRRRSANNGETILENPSAGARKP